jgi:16S rRNA (cytidine1402-2'-O)-methyltransferase
MTDFKANPAAQGTLYLVATPIGNLEDITLRALRILREVSVIACEDTRHTQKLLSHYEIRRPLVSYHQHNERTRAAELVARIEQGESVALVSDAGMPLVSDPGHRLVALAIERGIAVVPVPGASALLAALAAAGMPGDEFTFAGFLPSRSGERRRALERLAAEPRTLVLYEAPHRLRATLRGALDILGNRPAVVARELTKIHEEFVRGSLEELLAHFAAEPRGEVTLLIAPLPVAADQRVRPGAPAATTLARRVAELMREHSLDRKAALKRAARERGLSKREAYRALLSEEK